jgi:hypothetical protein
MKKRKIIKLFGIITFVLFTVGCSIEVGPDGSIKISTVGITGGSTGGSAGENTGNSAGEDTSGNTGSSTGESSGGNAEGSTGGNTGENIGDNTGENTGNSAEENTGGSTEGSTVENVGSSAGGGPSGNTGEIVEGVSSAFVGVWTGFVGTDARLTVTNTIWTFEWIQTTGNNHGTYTVSNGTAIFWHNDYAGDSSSMNGQLFGTATVSGNTLLLIQDGNTYTLTK